jgi:hypothetical protein
MVANERVKLGVDLAAAPLVQAIEGGDVALAEAEHERCAFIEYEINTRR